MKQHTIESLLTLREQATLPQRAIQYQKPMLATLVAEPFDQPDWIYERKFDGERCLAVVTEEHVTLYSRNKKVLNAQYPELVRALEAQQLLPCVLDGEVVAFSGSLTSFSNLQRRMHSTDPEDIRQAHTPVFYYLFDCVQLCQYDIESLSLRRRKTILKALVSFHDPLRYTIHRNQNGVAYQAEACEKGWEGIIAKDTKSMYEHARSRAWLKFKCINEQELVIGGYTDPQGSRIGFGALLLGYYEQGALLYAGKVGTGFDDALLSSLVVQLKGLALNQPAFTDREDLPKDAHWVSPALVAQVGFTEWTNDGRLRHPRFLGLREDKDPRAVIRERAK